MGSLRRIGLVTRVLIRQSRILLALLLVWPCVLSIVLLVATHGAPAPDDVTSILEQELFYGLVLAGIGASSAFGVEQRARRTQQILGRAVSRTEYLLALGAAAYLPFAGYVLVWLANALGFAGLLHFRTPMLLPPLLAEFSAGLLLCAAGLLGSVLLPQLLAAVVTGGVLAGMLAAGLRGWGAIPCVFALAVGLQTTEKLPWADFGETIAAAILTTAAAALVFERRDVQGG